MHLGKVNWTAFDHDCKLALAELALLLQKVVDMTAGTKMLVSNLGAEVTSEDLQELFEEHGGPLEKNGPPRRLEFG